MLARCWMWAAAPSSQGRGCVGSLAGRQWQGERADPNPPELWASCGPGFCSHLSLTHHPERGLVMGPCVGPQLPGVCRVTFDDPPRLGAGSAGTGPELSTPCPSGPIMFPDPPVLLCVGCQLSPSLARWHKVGFLPSTRAY